MHLPSQVISWGKTVSKSAFRIHIWWKYEEIDIFGNVFIYALQEINDGECEMSETYEI